MKPASFDYVRASGVAEATAMLAESGGAAKLLAGGQSLVPMLNFRLVDARTFIDINRIAGLSGIEETADGGLRIGALARHYALETSVAVRERFPVLGAAMKHVAHLAIRNRGTIGGSLSHADPAAELPALSLLLDARVEISGPSSARAVPAADFFLAPLTTALRPDEMAIAVSLPALPAGSGWGFEEVARRRGDFAVAAAGAVVALEGGRISEARIALAGVHPTPLRAEEAEELLTGAEPAPDALAAAAAAARDAAEPEGDLHGSADYRRHLTQVLTRRALAAALKRHRS